MARGPTKRVVLNRAALDEVTRALADGMFEVALEILAAANPPDATPFGEGLVDRGGALAYVNGQKVAGDGLDGKQPKPPRAARVSKGRGVVVIVGWGFPARFQEFGTVHHGAQPFFTPAIDAVLPRSAAIMAPIVGPKLPRP